MTLFGNVHVDVQKRAGDTMSYQCNETHIVAMSNVQQSLMVIMQNEVFSIILIREVNTVYNGIEFLP